MSPVRPNPQQRAVIETLGEDVVVRAGAGSGKTRTLAMRFAGALNTTDDWPGASVDQVLTITFTNKAATELVQRVRAVLLESGEVSQARRLDEAWVSTIDSFCSRLLRRYSLEAGVDPSYSVLGEVQAAALQDEAFAEVIGAAGESVDETAALLAAYGPECLREDLAKAHDRLRAMGRSPQEICVAADPPVAAIAGKLTKLSSAYREEVAGTGASPNATQAANLEKLQVIEELLSSDSSRESEWARRVLGNLPPGKVSKAAKPKELAEEIQRTIESLKLALTTVITRPFAMAFVGMVSEFADQYRCAKRKRGLLDFGDLVEETRQLFRTHPEIASDVAQQFSLLMVDEFQDTNRSQLEALDPIRRDNLCVVGDDQQSIYGFRYADARLFDEMMERVKPYPLTKNYRSHAEVLSAINEIFASDSFFGDRLQALQAGRTESGEPLWPLGSPRVEVILSDSGSRDSMTARAAQAQVVAERIARLMGQGIKPADIVILMRSLRQASVYSDAMRSRGIDTFMASGEAFYEAPEVQDVRSLLKIMIAPKDDAAMTRVLAGPLLALSPDTLFALRRRGEANLWEAINNGQEASDSSGSILPDESHRIEVALGKMKELMREHERIPLSQFVVKACEAFDYDLTLLAAGPSGRVAWGNVLKLSRMASELERVEPVDAGSFLSYLELHERQVSREPSAVSSAGENAVRIMSVHAAKGLEFPVVIVADLARSLTMSDSPHFLLDELDGEVRLGAKCPSDGSEIEGLRDALHEQIADSARLDEIAEEKRIFYVACTRAMDALILVGDTNISAPSHSCLAGLLLGAMGNPTESGTVGLSGSASVAVRIERPDEWNPASATILEPKKLSTDDAEAIAAIADIDLGTDCAEISHSYSIPSRVSYSSLRTLEECPRRFFVENVLGLGRFELSETRSSLGVGSVVHAVLESATDLRPEPSAIDSAASFFGLDPGERDRVAIAAADFASSPIADRVRSSDRYSRETQFSIGLSQSRLEGSIDLICWDGQSALIIDYKTGRDREAADSLEREKGYQLQSDCYALAALEAGATSVEVIFVFLEQDGRSKEHHYSSSAGAGIRADLEGRLEAIVRLTDESEYPSATAGEHCQGCPARSTLCHLPH